MRILFVYALLLFSSVSTVAFGTAKGEEGLCYQKPGFHYVRSFGQGESKAMAASMAYIDARKNALLCIYGGLVEYESVTNGDNNDVNYAENTRVSVSSENIDWSGFEFVSADEQLADKAWRSESVFRISVGAVAKIRQNLLKLNKEREQNRAIAAQVAETERLARERKAMVEKQRAAVSDLAAGGEEIQKLKEESESILQKIKRGKAARKPRDEEWVNMVTQIGCGVNYSDLVQAIGKAQKIEVDSLTYEESKEFGKGYFIWFVYGDFAILASIYDRIGYISSYGDVSSSLNRYEMTLVKRYRRGNQNWWICKS